jgi:hypothetical protein
MEKKTCQNCKTDFIIEPDDFSFYEKMKVPPPTFCPECRFVRRLAWRNEKSLYRNECNKCKKSAISVYPKDSNVNVYCRPCWWGDGWDGADYAMDFDDSKDFISQLNDLLHKTPVPSLFGLYATLVNSEYTNLAYDLKNCYMLSYAYSNENCLYGSGIEQCKDSVDNTMLLESELCYENVDCQKCYQTMYSVDCANCRNVYFSKNCVDCSDCFGCVNLRSQKYHIFNEPYSQEEYQEKLRELEINSYKNIKNLKEKTLNFWKNFPQKYIHEKHNTNVSGDYIYNSKNTHNSFVVADMEDSKFCAFIAVGTKTTDAYDLTQLGVTSELIYESLQVGSSAYNIKFCFFTTINISNLEYCISCTGSEDCFGCVGLKKKQYCILNKQYSKEEYEVLVRKIKKHMSEKPYIDKKNLIYKYGEFFPSELSPFGYNASTAQEFFPLAKEEALSMGYTWKDPEIKDYQIDILPENLPDNIDEVSDDILSKVIGCEHKGLCNETCSTAFKIVPEELKFYQRMKISIPRLCSNCRHFQRNKFRNSFKLWNRTCMCDKANHLHKEEKCKVEFETSYAPDRAEIVYCEKCYQQEVY